MNISEQRILTAYQQHYLDIGIDYDEKPVVGIMGFYGFGNLGDELIFTKIRETLKEFRVIPLHGFAPTNDNLNRLNQLDFIILGGGGLFQAKPFVPFDTFGNWVDRLSVPFGVLGLGIETLTNESIPHVNALVEQSQFFVVRDVESYKLLGNAKVIVAPDVTFINPFNELPLRTCQDINKINVGINVRPSVEWASELLSVLEKLPYSKVGIPFSVYPFYDDRVPLQQIGVRHIEGLSLAPYKKIDILIGMALHSIILAVQFGIPTVPVSYNAKVERFVKEVGFTEYLIQPCDISRLENYLVNVFKRREEIRDMFLQYKYQAKEKWNQLLPLFIDKIHASVERYRCNKSRQHYYSAANVAIIVRDDENSGFSNLAKTIKSCQKQTYKDIQILVLDRKDANVQSALSIGENIAVIDNPNNVYGKYKFITWLRSGEWIAADAIQTMVDLLSHQADKKCAVAQSYFIRGDNLIGKVPMHYAPFILCRAINSISECGWCLGDQRCDDALKECITVDHGLKYTQVTDDYLNFVYAAYAFYHQNIDMARIYLERVDLKQVEKLEILMGSLYYFANKWKKGEVDFFMFVFDKLDLCAEKINERHIRFLKSHILVECSYIYEKANKKLLSLFSMLRAIWYRPKVIVEKGRISFICKLLLGDPFWRFYIAMKSR